MGGSTSSDAFVSVPLPFGIPFVVLLLAIAVCPMLLKEHTWEKAMGAIVAVCSLSFLIPYAVVYGGAEMAYQLLHAALEYLSFIAVIFALYSTAGGVVVEGAGNGNPMTNTIILGTGAVLASIIGTTGASMLLVRPLLRSVRGRKYNAHTFVFFIFLVSNIGGVLTPIGDPPVFLGFLKGVHFFWPLTNLIGHWAFAVSTLLLLYLGIDWVLFHREMSHKTKEVEVDAEVANGVANRVSINLSTKVQPLETHTASSGTAAANWAKLRSAVLSGSVGTETVTPNELADGLSDSGTEFSSQTVKAISPEPSLNMVSAVEPPSPQETAMQEWRRLRLAIRVVAALKPGLSRGQRFSIRGWINVAGIFLAVGLVIASGYLNTSFPSAGVTLVDSPTLPGEKIFWSFFNMGRDFLLILLGLASWFFTSRQLRRDNNFKWMPFVEVAVLFSGIFITLTPILLMFAGGLEGTLGFIVDAIDTPTEYFWATGLLASFLDNAPTYLVFFNAAGGDAAELMTTKSDILKAITCGAVFMGCNTYIGNAPNLLVLNVTKQNKIRMPGFFGYILWAIACAGPVYFFITLIFFPWF